MKKRERKFEDKFHLKRRKEEDWKKASKSSFRKIQTDGKVWSLKDPHQCGNI
jgi:hypothetical protein